MRRDLSITSPTGLWFTLLVTHFVAVNKLQCIGLKSLTIKLHEARTMTWWKEKKFKVDTFKDAFKVSFRIVSRSSYVLRPIPEASKICKSIKSKVLYWLLSFTSPKNMKGSSPLASLREDPSRCCLHINMQHANQINLKEYQWWKMQGALPSNSRKKWKSP